MKLAVRALEVRFGERRVVAIEELDLASEEIVGLVGESGSGKSMTALAVLGLAQAAGAGVAGSIRLDGLELAGLSGRALRRVRGERIAMIFQNPVSAFNPVFRVGDVFLRTLRLHGVGRSEARERARAGMREVVLSPDLLARSPSHCARRCCWRTSRPARSTSPCRRRSSRCCAGSATATA